MRKPFISKQVNWSGIFIVVALLVAGASMFYTSYVANELKEDEQKNIALWARTYTDMLNITPEEDEYCDFTLHSIVMSNNTHTPMIVTDENYRIIDALNYTKELNQENQPFFDKDLVYLKNNTTPIVIEDENYTNYLYYKQSTLITNLEWFPYIQLGLLAILLLFAFLIFRYNREAEQERVWVGMAKETAHQLGTPITSLIGWIENIKLMYGEDSDLVMIANEMKIDVEHLTLVADRFSKIGAVPELKPINAYENLEKHYQYVKQRASRKITFDFPDSKNQSNTLINISPLLFDWVIENLLKNALDAMEGKGEIRAAISTTDKWVYIDIKDSGKGIPRKNFKTVFQPGFSTKQRGWGLGLSLCKRIVEKYHFGKIFVLSSAPNEGTTFRIQMPVVEGGT
jgi:signal transduction histidine kinase